MTQLKSSINHVTRQPTMGAGTLIVEQVQHTQWPLRQPANIDSKQVTTLPRKGVSHNDKVAQEEDEQLAKKVEDDLYIFEAVPADTAGVDFVTDASAVAGEVNAEWVLARASEDVAGATGTMESSAAATSSGAAVGNISTGALSTIGPSGLVAGVLAAAAMGGSSGRSSATANADSAPPTTSQTVFTVGLALGPTTDDGAGTTVTVYRADGTVLTGTGSWTDGRYTFTATPAYTGKVFIKVTDGDTDADYIDEATGAGKNMGGSLMAATEVSGTTVSVTVTPITTLAAMKAVGANSVDELTSKVANGEAAAANVTEANQAIAELFGLSADIDLAQQTPVLAINTDGTAGTPDAYGAALAAVSTYEQGASASAPDAVANLAAAIQVNGTTATLIAGATATALQAAANAPKVTTTIGETTLAAVTAISNASSDSNSNLTPIADTTAPAFTSAALDAAGTTLTLTYGEALDAANPPVAGDFAVSVGGSARTVSAVSVSGYTVVLTLASAAYSSETVTVGYTDPTAGNDANAIQDAAGNDTATITAQSVTNGSTVTAPVADTTAPAFTSAALDVTGLKLTLAYDEALDAANPPAVGDFAVTAGGAAQTISLVAVSGSTVTLTLAAAVAHGDAVTVAYTDPTAGDDTAAIQDAAGNDALTLNQSATINHSTQVRPEIALVTVSSRGQSIDVTHNQDISGYPEVGDYRFYINGVLYDGDITAVSIAGDTLTLTLDRTISPQDIISDFAYSAQAGMPGSITNAAGSIEVRSFTVSQVNNFSGMVDRLPEIIQLDSGLGQLIIPTITSYLGMDKVHYHWDFDSDGQVSDGDRVNHDQLDALLNAGNDTTTDKSTRSLTSLGYQIKLSSIDELSSISSAGKPIEWGDVYWSANRVSPNVHSSFEFNSGNILAYSDTGKNLFASVNIAQNDSLILVQERIVGTNFDDLIQLYSLDFSTAPFVGEDIRTVHSHGGDDWIDVMAGTRQIHVFAGSGDDTINMIFPTINTFIQGHHVYGDNPGDNTGNDVFNFRGTNRLGPGTIAVGRIEEFELTRDQIQIEGRSLDFMDLPEGVDIVLWSGPDDRINEYQQWIRIKVDSGGTIFYAINGARTDLLANTDELHFPGFDSLPDINNLTPVPFEDPHDYFPIWIPTVVSGIIYEDDDKTIDDVNQIILGSVLDDVISAGLNADTVDSGPGEDIIFGGSGNDYIDGGSGDDVIYGGLHDDLIIAGDGNDQIMSGWGSDTVSAGSGNDVFLHSFEYLKELDIYDGSDGEDVVVFSNISTVEELLNNFSFESISSAELKLTDLHRENSVLILRNIENIGFGYESNGEIFYPEKFNILSAPFF